MGTVGAELAEKDREDGSDARRGVPSSSLLARRQCRVDDHSFWIRILLDLSSTSRKAREATNSSTFNPARTTFNTNSRAHGTATLGPWAAVGNVWRGDEAINYAEAAAGTTASSRWERLGGRGCITSRLDRVAATWHTSTEVRFFVGDHVM